MTVSAVDSMIHTERLSAGNVFAGTESGVVLDQQTPLMMMKRHQQEIEVADPFVCNYGSIGGVQQVSAARSQGLSKIPSTSNGKFVSQTCDSSSGY